MRKIGILAVVGFTFAVATALTSPVLAKDDGASCIKRQMAKGVSACIAKAKCDGITSRKDQARLCP